MKVINPSVILEQEINPVLVMKHIEKAGRVCYKSENMISDGTDEKCIKKIWESGHESVIEHVSLTFRIICDRGVTHELVRHRIASYSQESTRYCNYSKDKFGNELTFIRPCFWDDDCVQYKLWEQAMRQVEESYFALIKEGALPQEARSVLPNSLKTEILVTMNLREWRHFLKLRTSKAAHPQMRQVAVMIYDILSEKLPIIFKDIEIDN